MLRNEIKKLFITSIFLGLFFLTLSLVGKSQVIFRRATGPVEIIFDISPGGKINRLWNFFSQGGEETGLMLTPAAAQIRALNPKMIRIDHLFDFPDLDQRVEEIIGLGAIPFLSLSYFPPTVSPELTKTPANLTAWQDLVQKTVQRYSGKDNRNLPGVYYEVWNEPDLFGQMSPETYFALYQASLRGALNCQNCNSFKIGGPAITSLKKNWMQTFLSLVKQNGARIDFVSWHSYQQNPQKTLQEISTLSNLSGLSRLTSLPELIISEWGSLPEISPLHDAYFDAAHTVVAVSLTKNLLSKLFAFELKDGLSPEGKKYWGRWGLLTHQALGLTPKPRYHAFIYLNKLLDLALEPIFVSPEIYALGSTDSLDKYAFVVANLSSRSYQYNLKLRRALPGNYTTTTYYLSPAQNPLIPVVTQNTFTGGDFVITSQIQNQAVSLIEVFRSSPALVRESVRDSNQAAKLSATHPPLIFSLQKISEPNQGKISFKLRPWWSEDESQRFVLFESKDKDGNGLTAWLDKGSPNRLTMAILNKNEPQNQLAKDIPTSIADYNLEFVFDNQNLTYGLSLNGETLSNSLSPAFPVKFGEILLIGSDANRTSPAEGSLDELKIVVNNETIYEGNFD